MRITEPAPGATDLDRAWGRRDRFYREFMADHAASIARVDPVILEICRLRMAAVLGSSFSLALRYQPAVAAGLDEQKIAALPQYADSPLFSALERRCIEFAEFFALQSSAIGDEDVAALQEAMGTEPMIYFLKALSVMDQVQRSTVAFDMALPERAPDTMPEFVLAQAA